MGSIYSTEISNMDFRIANEIQFYIHDDLHTIKADEMTPDTTLNEYLRNKAHLKGTKNMCLEGGCGACIVAAARIHPVTNREIYFAVNSCLVPIYLCHGWRIYTIEGIGSQKNGYHPIQKTLVNFNGTQCGYCSPGMVMNFFALYSSSDVTMKQVDNSFGGNICRCTGYRPILAAFKSMAVDANPELLGQCPDIEDSAICKHKSEGTCLKTCQNFEKPLCLEIQASKWIKTFTINETLDALKIIPNDGSYMFVGGNTAHGVFRRKNNLDVYIDVTNVKDLLTHKIIGDKLILGANMTLTDTMNLFQKLSKDDTKFSYLSKLADHIDLIANVPVRNVGTLAGNLSIKHEHPEFQSDIFLIFETVGATITIIETNRTEAIMSLPNYLQHDMRKKLIQSINLPALGQNYTYESYKIMARAQNTHAIVNAGFLLKLKTDKTVDSIRIVYGAITPTFIHAMKTEEYLENKNLFDNAVLQGAFESLNSEISPDNEPPEPSPKFRKNLAIALFYKFVLSIAPENKVSARNKSGGAKFDRPVSTGVQEYGTNKSMYPVTQPVSKLEALAQISGQAQYINDIPDQPGQLHAALVLAKAPPHSTIKNIDQSRALKLNGVVAYFDKNDIPGRNTFTPEFPKDEEVFCSGTVQYYYQPIGIVVATSQAIAQEGADLVNITYMEVKQKPLLSIREILNANATDKIHHHQTVEPKRKGNDIKHVIKGAFDIGAQYHFHMETQICLVVPTEEGLDMFPSTQWMDSSQTSASAFLNIPANKINVSVRRLGGAYGGKISRNAIVSCAAALAAHKLQKPVKLALPFETNMNAIGKRSPCLCDYEAGVDENGKIQYLNATYYSDYGSMGGNEPVVGECVATFMRKYETDTWYISANYTQTDLPVNTWCRSPGSCEGLAMIESIMEHIAITISRDSLQVRMANIDSKEQEIIKHINNFKVWAKIDERKQAIAEFNKNNRWRKRGISVVPMNYPFFLFGNWSVLVAIYQSDGTVAITHGGIEMGQGINTKAAQVCAYALGIPLEMVSVKPSNNLAGANSIASGGSLTSEAVSYAILKACKILLDRMQPIKDKSKDLTWAELVKKCHMEQVDLVATFKFSATDPDLHSYPIYGVCGAEIELDVLTGNHQVLRVDLLEDAGDSLSPEIDIGQIEGAFVMGLGYWTSEEITFNEQGKLLNNRTWNYRPPGAKDIPIDFRVQIPKNNPNEVGILKSKATAEPPLCMACCVPLAIRNAVADARIEYNQNIEKWYPFNGPSTVENIHLNSLHDYKQYTL